MFCQNCGKQNPDGAVFCEGCGAQIGTAPAAKTAGGFGAKLTGALTGCLKAPKATAAAVAAEKEGMAIAGVFAGINFLAIFLFLWRYIGAYFTKSADLMDVGVDELIQKSKIEYGIFPMLVAALGLAIITIAVTALVVFAIKKLNKQDADLKQLFVMESVKTFIPSVVLIVCALLSFLIWWFFPIAMIAVIIMWIVNICGEIGESENQLVASGVMTVALIVVMLLTSLLASWGIGETSARDKSMNEAYEKADNSICHMIFDTLMATED